MLMGESGASILAVDDHPANLLALSAIIEPLEARLVTAASGREALERAAQEEFAVILLDVMMPEMDGFETLSRLRAQPASMHTPVILVTAYELNPRAMDKVRGMGLVDYILKPIEPELLRSKVAALVALHKRGEALEAKDRGIAMLAHDLQNPLTVVTTSTSLLLRANLDPRLRNAAERISRGAARMSEMVRALTDYARAGLGAMPITAARMDLGDLCRELVRDVVQTDSARGIELSCAGDLDCEWDRHRLHQALSNLVSNAFRYGAGDVIVRAQGDQSHVEISVHNGGEPIPPQLLPVIFRPFERGEKSRGGLGLGLFIVHEIARAHGGDVSVTSSVDSGTTFTVRLPRVA